MTETSPSPPQLVEAIIAVLTERVIPSLDPSELSAETGLLHRGLALDSMAALELVTGLEERLGIMIDESRLEPDYFETIGSLASFIESTAGI